MKTAKFILRYSIGIIILFFVFKISSKSLLSSFLLLIPSVLIIPYTDNLIQQKIIIPKIIKYLVCFILLIFGMDKGFEAVDKAPKTKYIFESVTDFENDFNEVCESNNIAHHIENINVEEGNNQNVFKYQLTPYIYILGDINKEDDSIKDLVMFGNSDGTPSSIVDLLVVFSTLTASIDKSLEPKQRYAILEDLGLSEKNKDWKKVSDSTIVNNNKYAVSYINGIGWMFSFTKK